MSAWVCYLIMSLDSNATYIGASNDQPKRLYTHNIGKGAKYTKGQTWVPIIVIEGFEDKCACLSFESGWKRVAKRRNNSRLIALQDNCNITLKYSKDTKFNRIMDLLYFVNAFTYTHPKFICRAHTMQSINDPLELEINIFSELWINDLPWPYFIKCFEFVALLSI